MIWGFKLGSCGGDMGQLFIWDMYWDIIGQKTNKTLWKRTMVFPGKTSIHGP